MNRFAQLAAILVASETMAMTAMAAAPSCQSGVLPCQAGCYFYQHQKCLPSPMGYYSPVNDNNLYICPAGTFAEEGASRCTPCTPGTSSWADGFGSCLLCGPGTYAYEGASSCSRCNPSLFWGPGSPGIFKEGSKLFCLDPRSMPSPSPSIAPSMQPSTVRSVTPTHTLAPSLVPSGIPSPTPSLVPTAAPTIWSHTQSPAETTATTISPTRPGARFPSSQGGNNTIDNKSKPSTSPTMIYNETPLPTMSTTEAPTSMRINTFSPTLRGYRFPSFRRDENKVKPSPQTMIRKKRFRIYMPLLAVVALIIAAAVLLVLRGRNLKPPKTRRPPRTVPPPPPLQFVTIIKDRTETTAEVASPNPPVMLVPKRANISISSRLPT